MNQQMPVRMPNTMTPPMPNMNIPQPPAPVQQAAPTSNQVTMESVVAHGDDAAQRQHLGNLIFGPIQAINSEMAPRIVGLIVFTLTIPQILSIVNDS